MVYLETYPYIYLCFHIFLLWKTLSNGWYETIEGSSDPPTRTYFHQASQKRVS